MWSTSVPSSVSHFVRVWDLSLRAGAGGAVPRRSPAAVLLLVQLGFWLEEHIFHGRWRFPISVQPDGVWALLTEVFQIWFGIKEETLVFPVSLGRTARGNSGWKAAGTGLGVAVVADAALPDSSFQSTALLPALHREKPSCRWQALTYFLHELKVFIPWVTSVLPCFFKISKNRLFNFFYYLNCLYEKSSFLDIST